MGTNDAGDPGNAGQGGAGQNSSDAGSGSTPGSSYPGDPGRSGGDAYPPYPGSSYPTSQYPTSQNPTSQYPGQGASYSGYTEGVHGEPVPENAWQNPYPSSQQPPYPPQQPPYPPYGGGQYPGPYPYPVARPTNGMAVASLVLGILWIYWIGSILSLIFGYIARQQIRERGEGGDGMAVAGIVLGWIGVGVLVIFIAIFVIAGASNGFR